MPSTYHRNRFLLACGFILSLVVFTWLGRWFGIPEYAGYGISLLKQPGAILIILAVAAAVLALTVANTLIAGWVRTDAGLFCTALGLMALSLRGGPMRYALFGQGASIFIVLSIEIVVLFAMLGAGWLIVRAMAAVGLARVEPDYRPDNVEPDQKILAVAVHVCAMISLMAVLCRTDQKVQCLASVGVSALVASLVSQLIVPTRPSLWCWISPLFVGLLGYIWAWFSPEGLAIGLPQGYFAALARPLPLDYASTGVAGAMLGYWFARSWHREREQVTEQDAGAQPATK